MHPNLGIYLPFRGLVYGKCVIHWRLAPGQPVSVTHKVASYPLPQLQLRTIPMPPKPRAPRKVSAAKDATSKAAKGAMPPPPVPGPSAAPPPALPKAILEPEMDALSTCLRVSSYVLKLRIHLLVLECCSEDRTDIWLLCRYPPTVRQLSVLYLPVHESDVQTSKIQRYTPYPPRNLTASLGREIEKYEQLCDAMEAQLVSRVAYSHIPASCILCIATCNICSPTRLEP